MISAVQLLGWAMLVLFGFSLGAVVSRFWVRRKEPAEPAAPEDDHFALIARAAGDVGFVYDIAPDTVRWTSDLGADYLGYEPGELVFGPGHVGEVVHEQDREAVEEAWRALGHRKRMDLEARLLKKTGQWTWVHFDAVPLGGENGTAARAMGVVRDTQALHAAEEALAEVRRMDAVGTMAGGIAHEFNNHLTPVRGYIELALDDLPANHPAVEGLETALDRVEYCADLVAQVQAYGRKSLLMPREEHLVRSLPGMIRLAMSTDREKAEKVTLEEHLQTDVPPVWFDHAQLQEALVQLVDNAFDAMPEGGVLRLGLKTVYLHRQGPGHGGEADNPSGEYACISLKDSGEGINPEAQAQIFDPFFTTRGRAKARGMGLSMVQGMVAQHKGLIEVQSVPGEGTEVKLFLPIVRAEKEASEAEEVDGTLSVLPAAPLGRVLVADDEAPIRKIVKKVFVREGWEVEEADDASQAVERLVAKPSPDLLVLDLVMPGPPVEAILETIREQALATRVLLVSGFDCDTRIETLMGEGRVTFLGKPFSPRKLLDKVDEMLADA